MASPSHILFWQNKQPIDNLWHPVPGASSTRYLDTLPRWTHSLDLAAASVDIAPFMVGAGTIAYVSQLNSIGLTAPASVFKNALTISAMHRSALYLTPFVLALQAAGLEYRYFIPRWASDRERRRDEDQVRRHVDFGMAVGAGVMVARSLFRMGPRWSLMDALFGGALADLALREYYRAHNL